jgi:hypothetical protein
MQDVQPRKLSESLQVFMFQRHLHRLPGGAPA